MMFKEKCQLISEQLSLMRSIGVDLDTVIEPMTKTTNKDHIAEQFMREFKRMEDRGTPGLLLVAFYHWLDSPKEKCLLTFEYGYDPRDTTLELHCCITSFKGISLGLNVEGIKRLPHQQYVMEAIRAAQAKLALPPPKIGIHTPRM